MTGALGHASTMSRERVLLAYYAATPLFALLDLAGGVNLRLAGLAGHPGPRIGYYLVCVACAVAVWRRPRWGAALGLLEGAVTITLLVLAVMLPIVTLPATFEAGGAEAARASLPEAVANLLLSGPLWLASLHRNPLLALRQD